MKLLTRGPNMTEGNRSPIDARYDLIEADFLTAMAETMAEGDKKYGADNWKKGLPGEKSPLNHALYHIVEVMRYPASPDVLMHIAHAACNLMFVYWFATNSAAGRSARLRKRDEAEQRKRDLAIKEARDNALSSE